MNKDTTQIQEPFDIGGETTPSNQTISTRVEANTGVTCIASSEQDILPREPRLVPTPRNDPTRSLSSTESEQRLRQGARILATGAIRAARKLHQDALPASEAASGKSEPSAQAMSLKRTPATETSHHGSTVLDPEPLTVPTL